MDAESDVFLNFPRFLVGGFPEASPKVKKVPRIISTLIRSRQTPKLRLRDVRKVIRGRSKPIVKIYMESY